MYAAVSSYTGNPKACFGVWTHEHPCPTAWHRAASAGSSMSRAMAWTSSIALLATGMRTSPIDHEVQADTARRGPVIVRMGCLQNIGNPRGVLQCPDDDCAPVGSVQVLGQPAQTGTVPGEQDGTSAGMAVECIGQVHGTPDTITDNIETGPEPLDLRRFRCS